MLRRVLQASVLVLSLAATTDGAFAQPKPLPVALTRLASVCQPVTGTSANQFEQHLYGGRKGKPGWKIYLEGGTPAVRAKHANDIAAKLNHRVLRVDLALVVSKYIGETEKNLTQLFDRAAKEDLVLFFDEADALFSKRSEVQDAEQRYSNQDTSYILSRIEAYEGIVLLSSNRTVPPAGRAQIVAGVHAVVPVGPTAPGVWQSLCWRPAKP
jgi:hypothetical protein